MYLSVLCLLVTIFKPLTYTIICPATFLHLLLLTLLNVFFMLEVLKLVSVLDPNNCLIISDSLSWFHCLITYIFNFLSSFIFVNIRQYYLYNFIFCDFLIEFFRYLVMKVSLEMKWQTFLPNSTFLFSAPFPLLYLRLIFFKC